MPRLFGHGSGPVELRLSQLTRADPACQGVEAARTSPYSAVGDPTGAESVCQQAQGGVKGSASPMTPCPPTGRQHNATSASSPDASIAKSVYAGMTNTEP